ncbi:MAG: 5'-methylthioadenosine/adenosylhomocysteine nucleosidase [candidate division Zixibacteria bacterium]
MIGLMGALEEEIDLFRSYAEIEKEYRFAGMDFYRGTIDEEPVVIVQCGVGKVNAAISTQILIDRFDVDSVLLTGLAGSLVPYLQQGDIVAANYLVQHDVDLTAFGRRPGELPSVGRMIETDPGMLKRMNDAYDAVYGEQPNRPQLVVGTIISGDKFVSEKKMIASLQREFGAVGTEMEGAAVAHVCQLNTVPFLVICTISDDSSSHATGQFKVSLENAPINVFAMIRHFIGIENLQTVG